MSEPQSRPPIGRPSIPVMVVDDYEIWRNGVRSMLQDTEFAIAGEAESGNEALVVARQVAPRLVLLDIRMPTGGGGLDALVALKREHPRMAVIMLTAFENPTFVARAVAGGAAGYLLKGIGRDDLLSALRAVATGEMLLTREELIRSLRSVGQHSADADDRIEPLTPREEEVLRLVATGLPNRDIAPVLFIAESTVKTHVEHIIGKLGVSDRVQAAVWAARRGFATG